MGNMGLSAYLTRCLNALADLGLILKLFYTCEPNQTRVFSIKALQISRTLNHHVSFSLLHQEGVMQLYILLIGAYKTD